MSADRVAVVGGGILGCLIARELTARRPASEVILLERDAVAAGASRRSAGLHFPRGACERVREMSSVSEAYYARLLAERPDLPIHPVPMTVVAGAGSADAVIEAYLPGAKPTDTDATGDPDVRLPAGSRAWTVRGGHHADVAALAARLAPAGVREGVAVTSVRPGPDAVALRLSTGDELTVDRVLLAPGPWIADPAWADLVAPLGLRVKRVVALHVDRPVRPGDPCVVLHDEDAFLLPLAHRGHALFSYTCQEWDADPDTAGYALRPQHLREAREVLRRYAPDLAARCRSGRVFCDAYTPDRQPAIRALDPAGRVVFAGGANGSGYRLGPAMAAEAVDLIDRKGQ
ncbi:FAD-binding oxidoreductase [Plantactinospora sp. KBS50]|uniref:NAD(P)/FAD-dependent oxidoreductase n=1 Tax=Plantactinospora sp. KBS50 TaxID=2024580 RepID=UPI000BAAE21B|nr:FAD-binding oxidoreductase [Plantactinospora sp. KBS50]ASW55612.1 FAD-dependent oxidoreductase [Plantactinospora sp. KBS50]